MNKMKMTATLMTILFLASITIIAIPVSAQLTEVWVDNNWSGSSPGELVDGHTFGTDAFATIQDGINAVDEGGTVNVAAGTYDEYVDITKSLTLSGQSGAIVKPSTGEGNIIIAINADDVTVKGFEVDGTELSYAWAGIGSWTGCTGVTIKDNIVHDIKNIIPGDIFGLGIGLWRGDNNIYEDILIEGNVIYDTDRMGIYIGATYGGSWLLSASNIIKDNVVLDTMLYAGETFPGGCGGIALDAAKYCTVEGNTVYNTGTTSNPMPGIFLAHGSATGNQISGNDVYGQAYGIAVEINRGDVKFDGVSPAAPKVHYNNIHDNSKYGLIVLKATGKTVFATLNWWGDPTGPRHASNLEGLGDDVTDLVDYSPWLGATSGTIPMTYHVNPTGTIQSAITAASPGDTVLVHPGTYYEHILIVKALTVRSTDGADETIIDGVSFRYIVKIYSSDVTFEGFTVTNPNYAGGSDATGILVGAYDVESVSNVQILNNIVTQVRSETGPPSAYGATGINIGRGPLSDVVVSGNIITDIKNPEGATNDHTCGINVWDGGDDIEIFNNMISDIKYNGIILEYASNVRIEENSITECEVGIRVEPFEGVTVSGLTINYNNIFGNMDYGVLNTMEDTIDATNNWWGHASGPHHPTLNSDGAGDAVSDNVDFDPWLTLPFQFEDLKNEIQDLELPKGTENSLIVKLNAASNAFDRGDYVDSINILNAFINHVMAQSGKKITTENAEQLIGSAEVLIAYISTFFL